MRFLSLVLVLLLVSPVTAAIVKRSGTGHAITKATTLDESIEAAGIIFKGEFKESKVVANARLLKFKVLDPIRGVSGKEIILKEWAQVASPFTTEEVEAGKPYVFFFYSPSSKGLTSLIGEEQGYVDVSDEDKPVFAKRMLKYERRHYSGAYGLLSRIKTLGRKPAKASEIKSYTELRGVLSK
jgi:hypothetical protein